MYRRRTRRQRVNFQTSFFSFSFSSKDFFFFFLGCVIAHCKTWNENGERENKMYIRVLQSVSSSQQHRCNNGAQTPPLPPLDYDSSSKQSPQRCGIVSRVLSGFKRFLLFGLRSFVVTMMMRMVMVNLSFFLKSAAASQLCLYSF